MGFGRLTTSDLSVPRPNLLQQTAMYGLLIALLATPPLADAHAANGDPERGRKIFLDRELGHCILCHQTRQIDAPFQGNLGPDLSDVASRLAIADIRAKVEDPTVSNPESAMPAFHRNKGLHQVAHVHAGKPILTNEQLTDLMAFLATLKGQGDTAFNEP